MLLKNNKYFLVPYLFFLLIGAIILTAFSKTDIHLFLNRFYGPFSDFFFRYATYVAEGIVAGLIILGLLLYRVRAGILLFSSYLFASLMAQFLKRAVFNEYPRPKAFFEGVTNLRFVEGVDVHAHFSFPSGHATGAFALFFSLALIASKNYLKLLFFFCALLVAWSRIHLSQHFFMDIYFGSLLGVVCTLLVFWYFTRLPENNKLDVPVMHHLRKRKKT